MNDMQANSQQEPWSRVKLEGLSLSLSLYGAPLAQDAWRGVLAFPWCGTVYGPLGLAQKQTGRAPLQSRKEWAGGSRASRGVCSVGPHRTHPRWGRSPAASFALVAVLPK